MRQIHYFFASGFGSGYSPVAPGTAGSILAALIAFFIFQGHWFILLPAIFIFLIEGTLASTFIENHSKKTDPQFIVIDEMVGMWISLLFLPLNWMNYLLALLFFRIFDIYKLFPVNRLQNVSGGWGVMLDDVAAGFYALLMGHLIHYLGWV